ncbi:S-layer homology domain-containing protein [Paenibacillus chartarius]|uniref:S-layer homology domain-containing protein n=1 Tax=Paenibacillus chartarius TaxID=747481 RepID=A0ABV6DQ10_9BACL
MKNNVKIAAMILAASIMLPAAAFADTAATNSFTDIDGHWGKKYIEYLGKNGLANGKSDGRYEPDAQLTRAELSAMIAASMKLDTSVTSAVYFSDVKKDDWYTGSVNASASAGIVNGYEDGTFQPNRSVSREELAAIVVRALEASHIAVKPDEAGQAELMSDLKDAGKLSWSKESVAAMLNGNLMSTNDAGLFEPDSPTTRAQAAAVISRFYSLIVQ